MSTPSALIDSYLEGPVTLRERVAGLSTEQVKARPVPGKWSILEVVCHLVDSEQAWCHRMKRVIAEERPLLVGYDETRFVGSLACHERDLEAELSLFEATRRQMALILRNIPDNAWARQGVHTERGLMTLTELLQAEAEHVPHHLKFIEEKRKALGV